MRRNRFILSASAFFILHYFLASAMAADALEPASPPKVIELQPGMTKIFRVDRPIHTVLIGNPNIANASVISFNVVAITGLGIGLTNIILFDERGEEMANTKIQTVGAHSYLARNPPVARHEVRVIGWAAKDRDRVPDRRYLCGTNCGGIEIDLPPPLNPEGGTNQKLGEQSSSTLITNPPPAPEATIPAQPGAPQGPSLQQAAPQYPPPP